MKLSRRNLLKAGLTVGAISTGLLAPRLVQQIFNGRKTYIIDITKAQLDYLNIPDESLDEFASELIEYNPTLSSIRGHLIAFMGKNSSRLILGLSGDRFALRLSAYEERIAGLFLLSSDFFPNGKRTDIPVNYLALSDPYEYSCSNVLATLSKP